MSYKYLDINDENLLIYFCPVCGEIATTNILVTMPSLNGKCLNCNTPFTCTNRSNKYLRDKYEQIYGREALDELGAFEECIRKEYFYNNPLFNKRKNKKRIEKYQSYLAKNRADSILKNSNQPKCPTCSSHNVRQITGLERGASLITLGIFSKKINKSFKCNNCGYTW